MACADTLLRSRLKLRNIAGKYVNGCSISGVEDQCQIGNINRIFDYVLNLPVYAN